MIKTFFKILLGLIALGALLIVLAYLNSARLVAVLFDLPPYETPSQEMFAEQVAMRDGVLLETYVYLPEGEGPWPAVLIRDPYSFGDVQCRLYARYAIACVHQDVRGRFASGGEWYPVVNERNDGLDTLEWLIEQPWQDGNIGTLGGSYVGLVQWTMIDAMPAQVKTVMADVSHGDWYNLIHRNGHLVQGVLSNWALGLFESEASIHDLASALPPAAGSTGILGPGSEWYRDYLVHEEKSDPFWQSEVFRAARDGHRHAAMPVLMTGGWHDLFIRGQIDVFDDLPRRADSLLVIRNGSHVRGATYSEALSEVAFYTRLTLKWIDRHLKGRQVSDVPQSGYLLQDNLDREYNPVPDWPPAIEAQVLHLGAIPDAANCDGGRLATTAEAQGSASYLYDPANPVSTRGGSYNLGEWGVLEQGDDNCSRADVLSFATPPMADGALINGPIRVSLVVSSDAPDSAFTVKLQEKREDGRVLNIRDEITSLSFRNGAVERGTYTSGEKVTLHFELTPIRWRLQSGSSLRLDVSSSNYPMYNAHPNEVGNWAELTARRTATQTLYEGELSIPW